MQEGEFFCVCVCLFVHTMLSRFGSQVFRRGHLASLSETAERKPSETIIIIIIISNIIMYCRITLQAYNAKINSHLSKVRDNSLFRFLLFKSFNKAAAMAPQCFGARKSGGKIWGKGQVSVLLWQWQSPWPQKAAKRSKDVDCGAWSSCRRGDLVTLPRPHPTFAGERRECRAWGGGAEGPFRPSFWKTRTEKKSASFWSKGIFFLSW